MRSWWQDYPNIGLSQDMTEEPDGIDDDQLSVFLTEALTEAR